MALQSSGQISLSEVNTELGRAYNSEIAIRLAETGYYVGINTWSTYKPGGATPASLSEWYGYNHTQPMPTHNVTVSAAYHSDNGSGGVNIAVYLAEANPASVTFGVRITWIDDLTSELTYTNHFGTIPGAGYTSYLIADCYPGAFGKSYSSVAMLSASPNPNYDQQYVW